ncbi:MAG: DUF4384 domain-containing protein [Hyphomicrobiaceae bacterium]
MAFVACVLLIECGLAAAAEGDPAPADSPSDVPVAAVQSIVPVPPSDARAAKAYAVFDEFCARCHQTGKLQIPAAARPLANILMLEELALDDALVKPGLPDASQLYTIMLRQHATVDVEPVPGASAIQAIRDWIGDLPEPSANCGGRPKIGQGEIELAVSAQLAAEPEEKRKEVRFVSLSHLADACVSPAALDGYRQAIAKIVNTLSWGPEPIRLEAFGPDETVLKLDLGKLGWVGAHWDKLIQAYPYAALPSSRLSESIRRQTGTLTPLVRGDWLAQASTATPLYARLLGLPGRLANLQRILNVDIEANIRGGKARRAGLAQSTITRANRLVERHPTRIGSLWIAYDFATNEGRQNLIANPLGPTATGSVKVPFRHDAIRALFTLPNGFIAYSMNDARGDRLDAPPEAVERAELGWSGANTNAAACMACHRSGPFAIKDVVRGQTETDTAAPKELRDQILALYAPQAEMDGIVTEDQERYAAAQRKAGIDPELMVGGLEPVAALAREYTRGVGLFRLAAEAGLSVPHTRKRVALLSGDLANSGRRVLAGNAPRAEVDRILGRFAPEATKAETAATGQPALETRSELELLLWTKSDVYEVGQLATFHARSNQNCYLTLISLDRAGQATVLFPNEFEQDNLLVANKDLMLPAEGASYQFRLREKGRETLIGICQTVAKWPEGIQHDFERQRFTMLGDWRAHLAQTTTGTARSVTAVEAARPKVLRGARGKPAVGDIKPEGRAAVDIQARAAIGYDVR